MDVDRDNVLSYEECTVSAFHLFCPPIAAPGHSGSSLGSLFGSPNRQMVTGLDTTTKKRQDCWDGNKCLIDKQCGQVGKCIEG